MENKNYRRADSAAFAVIVSREIEGWYSNVVFKEKAIDRIVRHREEILSLLNMVTKYDVKKLTKYLDVIVSANRYHYIGANGTIVALESVPL